MAGEQAPGMAVQTNIGASLVPSLEGLVQFPEMGNQIGSAFTQTTQSAITQGQSLTALTGYFKSSTDAWKTSLEGVTTELGRQKAAVDELKGAYERLGGAVKAVKLPGTGLSSDPTGVVIDAADSFFDGVGKTVKSNATYERIVRDTAITTGASSEKATPGQTEREINDLVKQITKATKMGDIEAASLIKNLVDGGVDFAKVKAVGVQAAQFSVGQKIDGKATAALYRSLFLGNVGQRKDPEIVRDETGAVLEAMLAQAKNSSTGIADAAEIFTKVFPADVAKTGGGKDRAIIVSATVYERADKGGSGIQVISDLKSRIDSDVHDSNDTSSAEYARARLPDGGGTDYKTNYLKRDLQARLDTSDERKKEKDTSQERLSISIGKALQPITDRYYEFVALLNNALTDVVNTFSGAVTVLGGLALGGFGLVKGFGLLGKGLTLRGAGRAVLGLESGAEGGVASRVMQIIRNLMGGAGLSEAAAGGAATEAAKRWLTPGSAFTGTLALTSQLDSALESLNKATSDDASFREKAVNYGKAIGQGGGALGGGYLSRYLPLPASLGLPLGVVGGGESLGWVGGEIGGLIADVAGEDGPKLGASVLPGRLGEITLGIELQFWMLKQFLRSGGKLSGFVPNDTQSKTPDTEGSSAPVSPEPDLSQATSPLSAQPVASVGDVVRDLSNDLPVSNVLPAGDSVQQRSTTSLVQHFNVAPVIPITVQGNLVNSNELLNSLGPSLRQMFVDLSDKAAGNGQVFDRMQDIYGYS